MTSKRENARIRSIAQACGSKWPALMPVQVAACYVGMTAYKFRHEPQLANLIHILWGTELVKKDALDEVIDAQCASEEA